MYRFGQLTKKNDITLIKLVYFNDRVIGSIECKEFKYYAFDSRDNTKLITDSARHAENWFESK